MKNVLVYPTEVCRSSKNLCTLKTSVICQLSQNQPLNGWEGRVFLIKSFRCSEEGNVDFGVPLELIWGPAALLLVQEVAAQLPGPFWQPMCFLALCCRSKRQMGCQQEVRLAASLQEVCTTLPLPPE